MTESVQPATLLVFTLGAGRAHARRRLLGASQAEREVALHRACLDRVLQAGAGADCRVEVSSPEPLDLPSGVAQYEQSGDGFGERLRSAVGAAAGRTEGPLVVVGTDIPDLSPGLVRDAIARAERDPAALVVGPSPDGGFYLLAGGEPFEGLLGEVRWRSKHALSSLLRAARDAGRPVQLLPALADLDRRSDLESWLARARGTSRPVRTLLRELKSALGALIRPLSPPEFVCRPLAPAAVDRGRAPPL